MQKIDFVQDNESKSTFGVLRGMHLQLPPFAQSKLVRAISGKVLDVLVDIRPDSASYMQNFSIELTEENKTQLFVPQGCAHGFLVLSETAVFAYKVDNYYSAEHERGIYYADEDFRIDWPLKADQLKLSERDAGLPRYNEVKGQL